MASGEARLIFLGGLGEVGKNIYLVETDDAIAVIDYGLGFPDERQLGVDLVLPFPPRRALVGRASPATPHEIALYLLLAASPQGLLPQCVARPVAYPQTMTTTDARRGHAQRHEGQTPPLAELANRSQ